MEEQTPLPIFEDSGTPKNNISADHRSPPSDLPGVFVSQPSSNNGSEVFVTQPSSNNGSPDGELMGEDNVDNDEEFFDSLPPGYRFCPSDSDLIVYYLQKKINNDKLPRNQIRHVNLYHHSPEKISEIYPPVGDKEWYFFTPRDRKYRNGTRPNRAAGSGYWKATGADKPINHRGSKVGFRKALVYYEGKPPKGSKTNWIMHEYRVDGSPRPKTSLTDMRLDDFVLCRIYKKVDKSFKVRPGSEDVDTLNGYPSDYPIEEGTELFDQHSNAYLSDVDNKDDFHLRIDEEELKDLEASTGGLMQSQFNNGFRDIHPEINASFANPPKYYGNFPLPLSYAAKPLCYQPSYATENYINEGSLDIKPRGIHDNLWKDYETYYSPLATEIDFSIENLSVPDLDNLINNYPSGNTYETSPAKKC